MRSWTWVVLAAVVATGCDKEPSKGTAVQASASAAPAASEAPKPPEPPPAPRAPAITIDDHTCTVDGTALTGAPTEWRDAAATLLAGKPLVAGEAVVVNVMRDTKAPRVEAIVAALAKAKAKSVVVRTPTRDQSTGELHLSFARPGLAECSAVATIEHDGAVAVWNKGGGGAQRFSRGMAGPDLSSSTEALRKRAATCDSPAWFLGAADSVTWGLMFDLAMRAKGDGVAALKPNEVVLLKDAPTAGRKLKDE